MRKRKKTKKKSRGSYCDFHGSLGPIRHQQMSCALFAQPMSLFFFARGTQMKDTRERERKRFLSCVRRDGRLTDDEGVGSSHVRVEPSLLRMCRRLWPLLLVRWRFETRTTAARWALVPRRVFYLVHCTAGVALRARWRLVVVQRIDAASTAAAKIPATAALFSFPCPPLPSLRDRSFFTTSTARVCLSRQQRIISSSCLMPSFPRRRPQHSFFFFCCCCLFL